MFVNPENRFDVFKIRAVTKIDKEALSNITNNERCFWGGSHIV